MSNAIPTVAELNECVSNLNNAYAVQSFKRNPNKDALIPFSLVSCGYVVSVDCLGKNIFNTEDDPREYLEDVLGNQIITEDGEEAKEDLYNYLFQQYHSIVEELLHFKER